MMLYESNSELRSEFIKTYRPFTCIVGANSDFSAEILPHTLMVEPGHLVKHSAAWIKLSERKVDKISL